MNIPTFLWIILLPLSAAPLIYLAGRANERSGATYAQAIALAALLAAWVPFTQSAIELQSAGWITFTLGDIPLRLDGLSLLLAAVALGLGALVTLFSGAYMRGQAGQEKYYAMLVTMISVMIGLGCAADLFNLWIWFEAMAISSYLLVAFYKDQTLSLEASFKYLVQSAAGSVLILVGIGLVLMQTGSVNLDEIKAAGDTSWVILAAAALFIIGFGVKAALVPMHTWLPDAHAQAPSGISAMLSGIVIEAGLIAMLRALAPLVAATGQAGVLLMAFGALNMLVGNLLALRQTQVKRMLAFSSLVHVGYMLVGLGVAISFSSLSGSQGGFFHLLNHGMMKGLAFLAAGALMYGLQMTSGGTHSLQVSDLSGAARRYPFVALTLSLALLGLGGLPPLSGFMSKWQIMLAGLETRNMLIGGLVIFAALNSVLSLAYYAPLINAVYRREQSPAIVGGSSLPRTLSLPLFVLALGILVIGIWPNLMNWLTYPAGTALLAAFSH